MEPNNNIDNTQETQELIDTYLLGNLDAHQLAEFEKQMNIYPDFRKNVMGQKALMQGVEEINLKHSLNDFHSEIADEPEKKWLSRGWLALAASILVLISVSTWAVLSNGNSPEKVFASNFKPDPGLPTTMGTSSDYEFYHGMVNYKRKEYKEAISRWEPLYAANPENDTLIYFLGVANLANGNPRQAEKYLQLAKTKPNSAFSEEISYYLALSLLKGNKVDEAKAVLENSESSSNIVLLKELDGL
ncbi:tetratricopeptide repeat protein [Aequorivita lipolytica]|uniref:Tetratricopeptide repeat protein n=1 Tax=Aequorivita lipolytica TaxID=153267 RepID=A0A5C6YS99_9FLAO|nr:tetratricopeptide repeat protein [Aequorivita lipolytica]TXD70360.1 hypothetical protein ESV24_04125 [Aequorivita lipolytica]SRX50788.1 hypothetical protein AEQU2_01266 [Aequorivita lipolytica]